ncbi:alternative T antigen [New Jersey polyomavirus-2013]|uniref:Alternative T antigen n=1 Tax=New Jersey polyomavirus-2013 TaxID=1497391 RepID=A0A024B543_9POLY|nr:alternative T antigen [New Jersey polyomavirus-2013]AHZ11647.1 alternative T antigen [New Jersey polyomavirus-2013]
MEKVLEKSDKEMLIELLGIPRYAYGNFPIMKTAYKRASKIYHPDKGGSSEKMMLLNSLWQKFQEGLIEVRDSEVCQVSFSDCYDSSLLKCCSPKVFHELFLRSPQCLLKGPTSCSCITSCLYNQHRQIKLCGKKRSFLIPMAAPTSERDMQAGAPQYLPMKSLTREQIYTVMSPPSPPPLMKKMKPKVQDTTLSPLLPPQPLPPPLPPKKYPRRSVSLNSPRVRLHPEALLQEEIQRLRESLHQREEEVLKIWMDLILTRKQALRAHHQNKKGKVLIVLLICLLVCLILSVTLYLAIKQ